MIQNTWRYNNINESANLDVTNHLHDVANCMRPLKHDMPTDITEQQKWDKTRSCDNTSHSR